MRKGSILCVDDEEMVLQMETEALEELGYSVITKNNPSEALELIREQGSLIGLVITDVVMPEMTGTELAKAVHSIAPEMPVLLATGYWEVFRTELTPEAKAAGIRYILSKPFTKSELQQAIARTTEEKEGNADNNR